MNKQLARMNFHYVILVFILSAPLAAEVVRNTDGTNPFEFLETEAGNQNPTAENQGVNGLEGGVLKEVVYSQSGPQDKDVSMNDVSDKYGQVGAAGSAQTGKVVAIVTGTALIARGTPMAASILAPVRAAGQALIAKGILEFAQAAADASAESGNRGIEGDLRKTDSVDGTSMSGGNAARDNLVNQLSQPGLQDFLNGANPEFVADQLLTGQFTDVADVGRLVGQEMDYSPEELAEARLIEAKYTHGEDAAAKVQWDDSQTEKIGADASDTGPGTLVASNVSPSEVSAQNANGSLSDLSAAAIGADAKKAGVALAPHGSHAANNQLLNGLWNRFGAMNRAPASRSVLASLSRADLEALGLVPSVMGPNIFTKARRSYRKFSDWRAQR